MNPELERLERALRAADAAGDVAAAQKLAGALRQMQANPPGETYWQGVRRRAGEWKQFGRDAAHMGTQTVSGLGNAGYTTATGVAELVNADDAADSLRRQRMEMKEFYGEPQGAAGAAGQILGNVLGQGAMFMAPGAALSKAGWLPRAATFGGRIAQGVALTAPLDLAQAASGKENSTAGLLEEVAPNRLTRALAENPILRGGTEILTSAVGEGAIEGIGAGIRQVRNAKDILTAPRSPWAPVQGPELPTEGPSSALVAPPRVERWQDSPDIPDRVRDALPPSYPKPDPVNRWGNLPGTRFRAPDAPLPQPRAPIERPPISPELRARLEQKANLVERGHYGDLTKDAPEPQWTREQLERRRLEAIARGRGGTRGTELERARARLRQWMEGSDVGPLRPGEVSQTKPVVDESDAENWDFDDLDEGPPRLEQLEPTRSAEWAPFRGQRQTPEPAQDLTPAQRALPAEPAPQYARQMEPVEPVPLPEPTPPPAPFVRAPEPPPVARAPEPEPPTPAPVRPKARKAKDFDHTGDWDVEIGGKKYTISHNKSGGTAVPPGAWTINKVGGRTLKTTGRSITEETQHILGYNKGEALDELVRRVEAGRYAPKRTRKPPGGFVDPQLLRPLAGGAVGATVGLATGDEGQSVGERATRGLVGGLVGAGAGVASLHPKVQSLTKEYFKSGGHLPGTTHEMNIAREARLAKGSKAVDYERARFNDAARKHFGRTPTTKDLRQVDDVLHGDADISALPAALQGPTRRFREYLDTLSQRMIDEDVALGDFPEHIESEKGRYTTRSFEIFDNPKWASKVGADVKERARGLIRRENPDYTPSQVEGRLNELLARAEDGIRMSQGGGKLGKQDLTSMIARKEIPSEIRELWGENRDPRLNFARTAGKMHALLENRKFLQEVNKEGLGKYLHRTPEGNHYKQIAGKSERTMYPLQDLYTTPEIQKAFTEIMDPSKPPAWLGAWLKANALTKAVKTVGSPVALANNFLGNVGFAVANGHWRPTMKSAGGINRIAKIGGMTQGAWERYVLKLTELGVLGQSTHAGGLRDAIREAGDTENFAVKLAEKAAKLPKIAYQGADDMWKIFAFENELARYSKALGNTVPPAEVEKIAAKIVQNTYPTYSRVPKGVKALGRAPLVGNFPSFTSEVLRTYVNTLKTAITETKNPVLRKIGLQRLSGMIAATSMVGAAAAASRAASGTTKQDDEDARRSMAPWDAKAANLIHMGRDEKGNLRVMNADRIDPWSYLRKPLATALRGGDVDKALKEIGWSAAEPFFGGEILLKAGLEAYEGRSATGRKIYNSQEPKLNRIAKGAAHVGKTFVPGYVEAPIKYAKDGTVPLAPKTVDTRKAMSFRTRGAKGDMLESQTMLNSVLSQEDTTDAEIQRAYRRMNRARRNAFDELVADVQAARRQGMSRNEVGRQLRAAGYSLEQAKAILAGRYTPYKPSNAFYKERVPDRGLQEMKRRARSVNRASAR